MEVRLPTKAEWVGIVSTAGFVGQLFGYTLPTADLKAKNKDGLFWFQEQLAECHDEYREHMETEH